VRSSRELEVEIVTTSGIAEGRVSALMVRASARRTVKRFAPSSSAGTAFIIALRRRRKELVLVAGMTCLHVGMETP